MSTGFIESTAGDAARGVVLAGARRLAWALVALVYVGVLLASLQAGASDLASVLRACGAGLAVALVCCVALEILAHAPAAAPVPEAVTDVLVSLAGGPVDNLNGSTDLVETAGAAADE